MGFLREIRLRPSNHSLRINCGVPSEDRFMKPSSENTIATLLTAPKGDGPSTLANHPTRPSTNCRLICRKLSKMLDSASWLLASSPISIQKACVTPLRLRQRVCMKQAC